MSWVGLSALLAFLVTAEPVSARAVHQGSPEFPISADTGTAWSRFFAGAWHCEGGFPNGRRLAAQVTFLPELRGRWLQYRHSDDSPGTYQMTALWGEQRGGTGLLSVLHDNGGGVRVYRSEGWQEHALIFVRDTAALKTPSVGPQSVDRFTYRQQTDSTFWFGWELPLSPGRWVVGDSLTCRRQ